MTRVRRLPLLLACLIVAATGACAQSSDADDWVARAQAAHGAADEELGAHHHEAARRALESAVKQPAPPSVRVEDARVVRQDLYYRLAMVELSANSASAAVKWADAGLALGIETDVFTANLFIARAKAFEALQESTRAGRDYHEALKISESLLDQALGEAVQ